MTTLVIGKTGQLGRVLSIRAQNLVAVGRDTLDLSQSKTATESALNTIFHQADDKHAPIEGVVLAAAYTAVDRAESDEKTANLVNGDAPGVVAWVCAEWGVPLVHVSTDYVFDGRSKQPYEPNDNPSPVNAYGRSKRTGEKAVLATDATAAILRTSWVYDGTGRNFLTTMLRLGRTRETLDIVADQIGRPTYAVDLADACLAALAGLKQDPQTAGIYHVSNAGEPVSWAAFARAIFAATNMDVTVRDISSSDYPTPAPRPAMSVMTLDAFEQAFGLIMPSWMDGLQRALADRDRL